MNTGKVLLGVLAGVAIGATLGVLFAPDKGSATRKRIVKKGEDYAGDLKEKFNEFVEGTSRQFETAEAKAVNMAENVRKKAEEANSRMNTSFNKV